MMKYSCSDCLATTFSSGNPGQCGRCGKSDLAPVEGARVRRDVVGLRAVKVSADLWERFDRERVEWENKEGHDA